MPLLADIHPSVRIHETARISVTERLVIGEGGVVGEDCVIEGRDIEIGQEMWMDRGARIGGGSCFERQSSLRAGHFLHLGQDVFINTARPVEIGDEVGLGTRTALYTHGAYLSALQGFPVAFAPIHIGDRVWLPGATVNPGVAIGDDVVVAVGSIVTGNLPAGCLAGGIPAKVIRENAYPASLTGDAWKAFWASFWDDYPDPSIVAAHASQSELILNEAIFDTDHQVIEGSADAETEQLRNQLRRYGIRFYSRPVDGAYQPWRDR